MMSPGNAIALIEKIIAAAEHKDAKEQLKQYSASLNIKNASGETPLIVALRGGKPKAAAALIEAGADITAVDNMKETALHLAASEGMVSLIQMLVARKAKLEARNQMRDTPLFSALSYVKAEAAVALLEAGADATTVDGEMMTTLHWAAAGIVSLIPILISMGVKLEARDNKGMTPMFMAVRNNNPEAEVTLLETGADVTAVDFQGYTILHWAAEMGIVGLIPTLIARGANLNEFLQSPRTDYFNDTHKLLFIFNTVQGCFNTELMQQMAKNMEIILLEGHRSLLSIDSPSLLIFIQNNFDKIADIFFQHFNAVLEAAQKVLIERKINMDIEAIRKLITRTLVEHIASLLTPKRTVATWYNCINILCEFNDTHILPPPILGIIREYLCLDPPQNTPQDITTNNAELFEPMGLAFGLQTSDIYLTRRLFEERVKACFEYLVGRQQKRIPELASDKVLRFYHLTQPKVVRVAAKPLIYSHS